MELAGSLGTVVRLVRAQSVPSFLQGSILLLLSA
jgi:hypothetical protein